MKTKYIRYAGLGIVVFPQHEYLMHSDIAQGVDSVARGRVAGGGRTMSAGFVKFEGGKPVCHGRSDSLGLESLAEDTAVLRAQWGVQ